MSLSACPLCRDGIVFTQDSKGTTKTWRCPCPLGKKYEQPMYLGRDEEKKHPWVLPLYQPKEPTPEKKYPRPYKEDE